VVPELNETKTAIAESYDLSAQGFCEFADRLVYAHLAVPLATALADVRGTILDVASGTGALGRLLNDVVETDISHAQLKSNQLRHRVVADAESLPFGGRSFAAAACAFGINHFPDPGAAVAEMARVGEIVGVITWQRPDDVFAPKEIVLETIAAQARGARTKAGELVDEMTEAMGSPGAVDAVLAGAGLVPEVRTIQVEVPWPGTDAFIDYRLSMIGALESLVDPKAVRSKATSAIDALPAAALEWRPRLVLGIGRR
jgi:SAM-dependent methyltransferase